MDCPIHLVALLAGALSSGGYSLCAADTVAAGAKRERAVSPRVAEMLLAAAPAYQPAQPPAGAGDSAASGTAARARVDEITKPANTIVRLPEYVIRERKPRPLPKLEEILGPRELEKLAMNEFLGPADGFDRGFLNLFTVADLWRRIPFLGRIPLAGFETNEQRAMRMYRADREAKAWAEMMSLLTPRERAGVMAPTGAAPLK